MALTRRARSSGILFCRRALVSRVSVSLSRGLWLFSSFSIPLSRAFTLHSKPVVPTAPREDVERKCGERERVWTRVCRARERITLLLNHIYVPPLYPSSLYSVSPSCLPACEMTWNEAELFTDFKLLHERPIREDIRYISSMNISTSESFREYESLLRQSYFRIPRYVVINVGNCVEEITVKNIAP